MTLSTPHSRGAHFNSHVQGFTGSSPVGGGYDPFTDYGSYGMGSGGTSSPLQQYSYNRQLAYQALQNGSLSPQERQMWQKYLQDLTAWFQKYGPEAQSQAGWDPMKGDVSMNGGLYDGGSSLGLKPDFQNSEVVGFETGTDFTYNLANPESRPVYLYQQNIDLVWEKASGQIKISRQFDSFLGKDVVTVTLTDREGKKHKVLLPNVKNIKTHTADPAAQVVTDATFDPTTVKLENLNLQDADGDLSPKGTPPDETDGNTRTYYKNDSVEVYAEKGKIDDIAAGNTTLMVPDRRYKVYITQRGTDKADVEIYDEKGNLFSSAHLTQLSDLNLQGVYKKNVFYKDASKTGDSSKTKKDVKIGPLAGEIIKWKGLDEIIKTSDSSSAKKGYVELSEADTHDIEFSVNGEGKDTKTTKDPNPEPESVSKDGKTANYNKSKDVKLTAYYEGKYKNIKITSGPGGTVTLNTASFADKVWIERNKDGTYSILMASGEDPSKEIIYTIEGPPKKILIGKANIGQIQYFWNEGEWRSPKETADAPYKPGMDPLIEVEGEKSGEKPLELPSASLSSFVPTPGQTTDKAQELATLIDSALRNPDDKTQWDAVRTYLNQTFEANGGHWNNIIRKVTTALYLAAGSKKKFDLLLKEIPENVRMKMAINVRMWAHELNETQEGDMWNSQEAGNILMNVPSDDE